MLQIKYRARAEMWETQMRLPRIQGLQELVDSLQDALALPRVPVSSKELPVKPMGIQVVACILAEAGITVRH